MTTTTVAYLRVSTENQVEKNGLGQQRDSIAAYAAANNLTIDEWVEEAASGMREDRELIQDIIVRVEQGEIARVVIDRPDRLGRDLIVNEILYTKLREAGAEVDFVNGKFENTPTGDMVRQILNVVASFQRKSFLAHMAACRRRSQARSGKSNAGTAPFGYQHSASGGLIPEPTEAEAVREMFRLHRAGNNIGRTTTLLNEADYANRSGRRFDYSSVKRILERESFYLGHTVINPSVTLDAGVKPAHPPILWRQPPMHEKSKATALVPST